MINGRWSLRLVALLTLIVLLLGACAPTATPVVTEEPAAPAAPTETPTDEPAGETTDEEAPAEASDGSRLVLATTTSTYDSGLLDYILPDFEAASGITVDVIAVGTGQALQLGMDGNADVLLVHARAREDAFMDEGHGTRREDVMYNDFVIVGPAEDPAGILGRNKAPRAFQAVAETESTFISRGDDSGTHTKEKAIWTEAGIEPSGDWYVSAGQGMGAVLSMADEQQGYTLSDRATYLAMTLEGLELDIMVEGDPILFNPYGVLAVNPDKSSEINSEGAQAFIDWLISVPVQEKIGTFGIEAFGAPLFTPDSQAWRDTQATDDAADAGDASAGAGAMRITGNVAQELSWSMDELLAMEAMDVESENSDGEAETYTGVAIKPLLEAAQPGDDAATVVLVADDGYTVELPLADVLACDDCILAFRTQGGLTSRMPGFPKNTSVKGIIEIQVQ